METVYEAIGGYDKVLSLAAAWHDRVMADERRVAVLVTPARISPAPRG